MSVNEPSSAETGLTVGLSDSQRDLWELRTIETGFRAYNDSRTLLLRGPYDHARMEQAFQRLVSRHESLRALIRQNGESQLIVPSVTIQVPLTDLTNLAVDEREREATQLLDAFSQRSFDPSKAPLFRAGVVKISDNYHILTITYHRIYGDDTSFDNVVNQVCDHYEGKVEPIKPMQLNTLVELHERASCREDESYWAEEFLDVPPPLELPSDFIRPPVRSFSGRRAITTIDRELLERLRDFGGEESCSLFTVLLAAWTTLLHRLSCEDDLVIGVSFEDAFRAHEGGATLLANTSNSVPFRSRICPSLTFLEYLRSTQHRIQNARDHQQYSCGRILKKLNLPPDLGRPSLFSVTFNHGRALTARRVGLLEIETLTTGFPHRGPRGTSTFELVLNVEERADRLEFQCDFSADLFLLETVERWLGHLNTLLTSVIANPEERILFLPILTAAERHQILVNWNDTHRDYPRNTLLHEFFERQVQRSPKAIAVVFEDRTLTYKELNQRVNRLSRRLRKLAVGPDCIVGILANRSFEMLVGILATLKAGGAYLPLDPNDPLQRLAFVLQDAKPAVILAQRVLASRLPPNPGMTVMLDEDFSVEPDTSIFSGVQPENIAYIIYTSGSTGRPKGALNSHRGLSNWLYWMQELFSMSPEDAMLQKSPYTFDVSVREFFLPLSTGGRVVIARPDLHGDSHYLVETICKHDITAIHFVPAMLSAFLEDADVKSCVSLRLVMCSGDALSYHLQEKFFETFPTLELHNMWGATEHAPESSYYKCRSGERGKGIVPVGKPGANTQLYVLDREMQPVPIGVVGEAYLGGIQTGLGYLARPQLTAQKFLSNPFRAEKLYKTGDLARFRTDGVMEFMGRADHQVKLRGFRIELGEVETVLKEHEAVRSCVAIVHEDRGRSSRQLVAYVAGEQKSPDELRRFAQQRLPDYMVPSAFVFLDKIPLTANGKVDRSALPPPAPTGDRSVKSGTTLSEGSSPVRVQRYEEVERRLTEWWQDMLDVEVVALEDDFFELGGDSLIAVRLLAKIKQTYGADLGLSTLLRARTVEQLSAAIRAGRQAANRCLISIQPSGSKLPLFCLHGLNGEVMFCRHIVSHLRSDQPVYGIVAGAFERDPGAYNSIETIAKHYLREIRRVQPVGAYRLCGFSFGGFIAFEMARQLEMASEQVGLLAIIDTVTYGLRIRRSLHERLSHTVRRLHSRFRIPLTGSPIARRRMGYEIRKKFLEWSNPQRNGPAAALRTALSRYEPEPYRGSAVLFRARDRSDTFDYDRQNGWGKLILGSLDVYEFDATHLSLIEEPCAQDVANRLTQLLSP